MRVVGWVAVSALGALLAAGSWVLVFDSPVRWGAVVLGASVGGLLGWASKGPAGACRLGEGCWVAIVLAVALLVSVPWLKYPFAFQGMLSLLVGSGLGTIFARLAREPSQEKDS